jgi:LPS-assembly lipoprotein
MKRFFVLGLILLLPACSLQPLYAGGHGGHAAQSLRQIEVPAIEGKAGWLVRDALSARLGSAQNGEAQFRLEVVLDDQITGFGVRRDDTVTRERRTLRARYKLIDLSDNSVRIDASAGSDAGIDVVSSEYATVAAENTALERLAEIVADQIVTRIALDAGRAPTAK